MNAKESDRMKKDLTHYLARWLTFGGIAGYFTPIVSPIPNRIIQDSFFWGEKLHHILLGLLIGAVCGIVFTFFQNRYNTPRNRKITWSIVFALWMGFNLAFAGIMLPL